MDHSTVVREHLGLVPPEAQPTAADKHKALAASLSILETSSPTRHPESQAPSKSRLKRRDVESSRWPNTRGASTTSSRGAKGGQEGERRGEDRPRIQAGETLEARTPVHGSNTRRIPMTRPTLE